MITIELTDEEALHFRAYMEHRVMFNRLLEGKLHELHDANAVISFDGEGVVRKIKVDKVVFHKKG